MSLQVLITWRKNNLHQNPDCLFAKALAFVSFRKHWNYLGSMCAKVTPTSHCDCAAVPWNFQLYYFSELFFKTAVQNVCIGRVLGFSFFLLFFLPPELPAPWNSCASVTRGFESLIIWHSNFSVHNYGTVSWHWEQLHKALLTTTIPIVRLGC